MTEEGSRFLICTGPTGGHFFPAVSFAERFRAAHPNVEIHFLMNRLPEFARIECDKIGAAVHLIPFRSSEHLFSFQGPGLLIEYIRAFGKTTGLIRRLRPALVVGFGSYGSVFGVVLGRLFGVPVLLHEQNAVAGRANRMLSVWAKRIGTSFPATAGLGQDPKVFWSGYPLRQAFLSDEAGTRDNRQRPFTLLTMGGSQGAQRLNRVVCEVITQLLPEEKTSFAVIHITGNDDFECVREIYRKAGVQAEVVPFSDRISDYFLRADLVVSRAGAGTLFELAAVGRAAILVPYPHAQAHQKKNAEYAASRGWARMILDEDLSAERLIGEIRSLWHNHVMRQQLAAGIQQLSKRDADRTLAEAAWKLQHERV